jgi:hypothetical protein
MKQEKEWYVMYPTYPLLAVKIVSWLLIIIENKQMMSSVSKFPHTRERSSHAK